MKEWLEYAAVRVLLKTLEILPRNAARSPGSLRRAPLVRSLAQTAQNRRIQSPPRFPRLDATPNAPQSSATWSAISAGWPPSSPASRKYSPQNIEQYVILDGHENFLEGQRRGKGVLYLTGHIGAWELSSFAHALYGYPAPLHGAARSTIRRIDALVNRYRCSQRQPADFQKRIGARCTAKSCKEAGTVGILADQNTMRARRRLRGFFRQARMHHDRPRARRACTRTPPSFPATLSGTSKCENIGCASNRPSN